MKLNIWQILGLVLLIVVIVLLFRKNTGPGDVVNTPTAPTTQK